MKRVGLAILGLSAALFAQDNLAQWSKYKVISVNTKASGANVATSVSKFPVLVRLNATNANDVFTDALANGADIRFANAAGASRPYQIESWDATAKTAAIWVLADSVKGNDSVATLRIYWGRPATTSASNGAAVFDTANGYRAVYHLSGGTSATENDATAMANHMSASDSVTGSVPGDTIGMIGSARKFAGDSTTPAGRQYFVATGSAGKAELNWGPNNPHTISAWVYARDLHKVYNQYGHGSSIFNKGDKQYAMQAYGDTANRLWEGALYANENNGWRQVKSRTKALTGGWYHIATTWGGGANGTSGTAKLFINGVLDSTIALAIGTGTSGNNLPVFTYNLYLGANPTGGATNDVAPGTTRGLAKGTTSTARFWNGYMDEVTLARGARSDDFVKLSYQTQKASANAVVLGATQTQAAAASLSYSRDSAIFASGVAISPLIATFSATGAAAYTVTPTLPAGLTLNATTGRITGTPSAASAIASYTVKAATATDTATKVLRVSVVDPSTENYATGWSVHKDIWLNTQGNGAATTTPVGKFPVLVRLTADVIGTGTQPLASGADFRFTKDATSGRLPYEIESWDAATKTGAIWVRVDTVLPNNGTQKFFMHWGNSGATSLSSGPSVFDTAAGFQAVWHLNGTANEADASLNGFTAVAAGAPTVNAAGAIGPARSFNGTNQYFSVPNTASGVLNFKQTQSYTLSSWINPTAISTAASTGHKIIDKGDNQYVLATYGTDEATRYWEITIKANGAWNQCQADGAFPGSTAILASSSVNAWNHLVGTYTGGAVGAEVTQRLYYNGKLVNQCVIANTDSTGRTETYNVHLGVQAAGTAPGSTFSRYWQGSIDEPRLASKARSADWVKLEYSNQKSTAGNNLVSWAAPVSVNGAMASMARTGLSVKASNNGLQFQVGGLSAVDKATLSLVDAWGRTVYNGAFEGDNLNWNGRANNGQEISAGVFVARVKILSADGRSSKVLEHRVPFTR